MKMKKIVFAVALSMAVNIMTPFVMASSSTALDIDFGEKLTLQETQGYTAYKGENSFQNFEQAKAELPDEVPVLEGFTENGTNVYYVAEGANGDGSITSPCGSIADALALVAQLSADDKAKGTIIYVIGASDYITSSPIEINESHTSTKGTLFIVNKGSAEVIIRGQAQAYASQAKLVNKDTVSSGDYNRVNNRAIGKLYYIDYEALGVTNIPYGSPVYYNNTQLNVARYPNQGNDTPVEIKLNGTKTDSEGFLKSGYPAEWKSMLNERPFEWVDTGNIHVYGKLANEWAVTDGVISLDKANKTIKTVDARLMPNNCGITTHHQNAAATYYYLNVFEEIDMAGEFFADNDKQRLYFYPPKEMSDRDTISLANNDGFVFDIKNANNVVFDNIKILNATNGINIENSNNVVIQNSEIKNIQSRAVRMYNTEKCGILNSSLGQSDSDELILISQSNDRAKVLKPRRNFVQNTYMYNAPKAMTVSGYTAGNIISHNLFENIDYSGITISGGAENIIEYNEFTAVTNKISDGGPIYVGGNILNRANTIRYNYFHDPRPDKITARAIYNDDCSDMSWNYGNVIRNYGFGLFQHSGDDHVIMDNIVINAGTYIRNSADYSAQKETMASHLFKKTLPGYWSSYESLEIGNSATWTGRFAGYASVATQRQQAYDAREAYHNDPDMYNKVQKIFTRAKAYSDYTNGADVQKVAEFVVDTGCYYKNNTIVNIEGQQDWGYGPSDYGKTQFAVPANDYDTPTLITKANKTETDAYDVSAKVVNMGLKDVPETTADAPVVLLENGIQIQNDEYTGISWNEVPNVSYYKVEIATDADFASIVDSAEIAGNEYSRYKYTYSDESGAVKVPASDCTYLNGTTYYVRVTPVTLANCVNVANAASEAVKFTLKETIDYNREVNNTIVEYGNTSHMVTISGEVPDYLTINEDKQVTIMLYEGEEGDISKNTIKQLRQITPEKNNTFSYTFKPQSIENMRVRVRTAQHEITDDLFSANAVTIDEIKFNITTGSLTVGEVVSAAAVVNNKFNLVDEFTIMLAAYDSNNKLLKCAKSDTFNAQDGEILDKAEILDVPEGTVYVKAFMWKTSTLAPWANSDILNAE